MFFLLGVSLDDRFCKEAGAAGFVRVEFFDTRLLATAEPPFVSNLTLYFLEPLLDEGVGVGGVYVH